MWRRLMRWWWMRVMDITNYTGPDRLWLWALRRAANATDWGDEGPSQDPPF